MKTPTLVLVFIYALGEGAYGSNLCTYNNFKFNCQNKRVTSIPKTFPNETTIIDLDDNQIQRIDSHDFNNLKYVEFIELGSNKITELTSKSFYGLNSLKKLDFSYNHLKVVPDDLIVPIPSSMEYVSVNNNNITTFPLAFLLKSRTEIRIYKNPIHCDCFSVIPAELRLLVKGTCATPISLNGRFINSIKAKDVNCEVCSNNPCHNGVCYSYNGNDTHCACFAGFEGDLCDIKTGMKVVYCVNQRSHGASGCF